MSIQLHQPEPARSARDGEAEIGERVTVLDLTTSVVADYRLVSKPAARAAEGEISIHSSLGSALLGRHVGDVVSVEEGRRISRLEVVEIDG
ncbi:MAG TPA: GreA/GreB family elongation factor [Gaiellaceae bacterium]|nr:GreA/GreB family elongation factor [Gaiellaceae bacterium]